MGLDIRVCKNATFVKKSIQSEDDYELHSLYNCHGCSQTVKQPGLYKCEEDKRIWSAPYSFYNRMRELLAVLTGTTAQNIWADPQPDLPFVELINNSDCEARFDTDACKALAEDFRAYFEMADKHENQDFIDFYKTLAEGFEIAATTNGCIIFS